MKRQGEHAKLRHVQHKKHKPKPPKRHEPGPSRRNQSRLLKSRELTEQKRNELEPFKKIASVWRVFLRSMQIRMLGQVLNPQPSDDKTVGSTSALQRNLPSTSTRII
ncbi:hypothetical protein E2562_018614 [Oryza meyeriana var. granulata]|uniref:Uncharacterized protein n=1 Tax=Oryza meyeriana var. granulata TaxID=110450 RepID=A0A6G1BXZ1_9ORYZ|nr:hypothetical protein E2562_018614 [Oryza meyeriana var. granulata]